MVVEGGHRQGGAQVVLGGVGVGRAEAGALAVLAVHPPQVLGEPVESGAGQLQVIPAVLTEGDGLLFA